MKATFRNLRVDLFILTITFTMGINAWGFSKKECRILIADGASPEKRIELLKSLLQDDATLTKLPVEFAHGGSYSPEFWQRPLTKWKSLSASAKAAKDLETWFLTNHKDLATVFGDLVTNWELHSIPAVGTLIAGSRVTIGGESHADAWIGSLIGEADRTEVVLQGLLNVQPDALGYVFGGRTRLRSLLVALLGEEDILVDGKKIPRERIQVATPNGTKSLAALSLTELNSTSKNGSWGNFFGTCDKSLGPNFYQSIVSSGIDTETASATHRTFQLSPLSESEMHRRLVQMSDTLRPGLSKVVEPQVEGMLATHFQRKGDLAATVGLLKSLLTNSRGRVLDTYRGLDGLFRFSNQYFLGRTSELWNLVRTNLVEEFVQLNWGTTYPPVSAKAPPLVASTPMISTPLPAATPVAPAVAHKPVVKNAPRAFTPNIGLPPTPASAAAPAPVAQPTAPSEVAQNEPLPNQANWRDVKEPVQPLTKKATPEKSEKKPEPTPAVQNEPLEIDPTPRETAPEPAIAYKSQPLVVTDAKVIRDRVLDGQGNPKALYLREEGLERYAHQYHLENRSEAFSAVRTALQQFFPRLEWTDPDSKSGKDEKLLSLLFNADGKVKDQYQGEKGLAKVALDKFGGDKSLARRQISAGLTAENFKKLGYGPTSDKELLASRLFGNDGKVLPQFRDGVGLARFQQNYASNETMRGVFFRVQQAFPKQFESARWKYPFDGDGNTFNRLRGRFIDGNGTLHARLKKMAGQKSYAVEFHQGDELAAKQLATKVLTDKEYRTLGWEAAE